MNLSGYEIKPESALPHWTNILESWLTCMQKFAEQTKSEQSADAAHAHSESMDRHMISVAAWKSDYITKQEFGIWKFAPGGKRWWGRADLWIKSPDAIDLIEAKTHWPELACSEMKRQLLNPLQDAISDARAHAASAATNRLGLGFVAPHHDAETELDSESLIQEWISTAQGLDIDILAWSFPPEVRRVVTYPENNQVFPGVILLGKRVREDDDV